MELAKEFEGRGRANRDLGCWIEPSAKKLKVGWYSTGASTVPQRYFVHPVGVENEHLLVAADWVLADHAGMVKLNDEAEGFQ